MKNMIILSALLTITAQIFNMQNTEKNIPEIKKDCSCKSYTILNSMGMLLGGGGALHLVNVMEDDVREAAKYYLQYKQSKIALNDSHLYAFNARFFPQDEIGEIRLKELGKKIGQHIYDQNNYQQQFYQRIKYLTIPSALTVGCLGLAFVCGKNIWDNYRAQKHVEKKVNNFSNNKED